MSDLRQLDRLSIPNPCQANWDEMDPAANTRFCESCNRTVHDFSSLTRRQAAGLVENSSGRLCARITYDRRGRIEFLREPRRPLTHVRGWFGQLAVLAVSALGSDAVSLAQPPARQIEVRVLDETGAVIPGAKVKVTRQSVSQAAATGTTGGDGIFGGTLPAGEYTLDVEARGFPSYQKRDVRVNCDLQLPVQMDAKIWILSAQGADATWPYGRRSFR